MLIVGSIVIRVDDLVRQEAFWTRALGYERRSASEDFVLLAPQTGDGPNVSLDAMSSARVLPPRIHLDLYADDQAEEVARLTELGAREVEWSRQPADADYVIMQDPEGNRFCVVDVGGRGASGDTD